MRVRLIDGGRIAALEARNPMKRVGFVALSLLATVALVLWLASRRDDVHGSRPPQPAPPAAVMVQPTRPVFTMAQLYEEGRVKAGAKPDQAKATSNRSIDDTVADVLDTDPVLSKFHELRRKALRTSIEQQEYLAMISNKQLIANARADLLASISRTELDQHEEVLRLQRIQFLNSALAWEDNPERAEAVEAVSAVVMMDVPSTLSNEAKGSVLGDKFDLFQLLMLSDPTQAEALLANARGTSMEKIVQLAWQTAQAGKSNQTR
jgi:hypothetical protein